MKILTIIEQDIPDGQWPGILAALPNLSGLIGHTRTYCLTDHYAVEEILTLTQTSNCAYTGAEKPKPSITQEEPPGSLMRYLEFDLARTQNYLDRLRGVFHDPVEKTACGKTDDDAVCACGCSGYDDRCDIWAKAYDAGVEVPENHTCTKTGNTAENIALKTGDLSKSHIDVLTEVKNLHEHGWTNQAIGDYLLLDEALVRKLVTPADTLEAAPFYCEGCEKGYQEIPHMGICRMVHGGSHRVRRNVGGIPKAKTS